MFSRGWRRRVRGGGGARRLDRILSRIRTLGGTWKDTEEG